MRIRCRFTPSVLIGITFTVAWICNSQAADPPGWKLAWSDEFGGHEIDKAKWDFDVGNGFYNYDSSQWMSGWGNGELQYYTREADNSFVHDGQLHIRAIKESFQG